MKALFIFTFLFLLVSCHRNTSTDKSLIAINSRTAQDRSKFPVITSFTTQKEDILSIISNAEASNCVDNTPLSLSQYVTKEIERIFAIETAIDAQNTAYLSSLISWEANELFDIVGVLINPDHEFKSNDPLAIQLSGLTPDEKRCLFPEFYQNIGLLGDENQVYSRLNEEYRPFAENLYAEIVNLTFSEFIEQFNALKENVALYLPKTTKLTLKPTYSLVANTNSQVKFKKYGFCNYHDASDNCFYFPKQLIDDLGKKEGYGVVFGLARKRKNGEVPKLFGKGYTVSDFVDIFPELNPEYEDSLTSIQLLWKKYGFCKAYDKQISGDDCFYFPSETEATHVFSLARLRREGTLTSVKGKKYLPPEIEDLMSGVSTSSQIVPPHTGVDTTVSAQDWNTTNNAIYGESHPWSSPTVRRQALGNSFSDYQAKHNPITSSAQPFLGEWSRPSLR